MAVEHIFRCEGPDCERHVQSRHATPPRGCGFLTITSSIPDEGTLHFCGWDCVLRHAATKEPEEVVPWEPDDS